MSSNELESAIRNIGSALGIEYDYLISDNSSALEKIRISIYRAAMRFGHSPEVAKDFSRSAIDEIIKNVGGGSNVYLGKTDIEQRNANIRADFTGNNYDALCTKYGLSKSQVYRITGK